MTANTRKELDISLIGVEHVGVTTATGLSYCEAAAVCLEKPNHSSPRNFTIVVDDLDHRAVMKWQQSTSQSRVCHLYPHDAIKDGAYAISLVCMSTYLDLVATGQAEAGSGSDWYVAPTVNASLDGGFPDMDGLSVYRLEVSGTMSGNVATRVKQKEAQICRGNSSIPGIISVVGYHASRVIIKHVTPGEATSDE